MNKTRTFKPTPLAAAIGAVLATTAPQVYAQSDDGADELEEIIVTASRREQNILDVPYNISAVSGEEIEAAFTLDNEELLRSIPGISNIDQGPRNGAQFSSIRIRGLNVDNSTFGDFAVPSVATVSTYVGETPVYANLALIDLDRVEVLRGPQGTLYGSGALGGTIKYHLRAPQFGEQEGRVGVEVSSVDGSGENGIATSGTFNLPMGDNIAMRANVLFRDFPGITDYVNLYELDANGVPVQPNGLFARGPDSTNYESEEDSDDFDSVYLRWSLRHEPTESFSYQLNYIYQDDDIGGRRQQTQGTDGNGVPYGKFTNGAVIREPSDREFDMGSLEVSLDFGFATLTSATSYYDNSGSSESDNTGFYANNFPQFYYFYPRPLYTAERTWEDAALVQELRLVSSGENTIDYVAGVFYRDQNRAVTQVSDLVGFEAFADALFPPVDFVSTDNVFTYLRDEDFTDFAVFGELTWNVSDRLRLTGGLRFFDIESDVNTFVRAGAYDSIADSVSTPFNSSEDDVLYKANLAYNFGDDELFYATISEGYRRGGNNGVPDIGRFANDPGWQIYNSDSVTNMEIGVKGTWQNQRYDVSIFSMDWDDPQFNTDAPVGSFFAVVNGEEAETSGLEIQISGGLNERLGYAFGYAFVDAELSAPLVEPININTGLPTQIADSGAPLPGIAEHIVNAAVDYVVPFGPGELALRFDAYYQSETQNVLQEGIALSEEFGGFTVLDASVAWYDNNWSAAIWVKNLSNEEGTTGSFTPEAFGSNVNLVAPLASAEFFGSNSRQFLILPRTLGFTVSYAF
ncbi:MAG: TonB-dependent receptor [Pseudomonadota bacterium]